MAHAFETKAEREAHDAKTITDLAAVRAINGAVDNSQAPTNPLSVNDPAVVAAGEQKRTDYNAALADPPEGEKLPLRRINGDLWPDLAGWHPEKRDFPLQFKMPCGTVTTYANLSDIPQVDTLCGCGDPDCFVIKIP